MKQIVMSIMVSLVAGAHAAVVEEGVFIPLKDKALVELIQGHPELTLDHMSESGFELYGPRGTKKWLADLNVEFRDADDHHSHIASHSTSHNKAARAFSGYPSHEEITSSLKYLAGKYPKIMRLFSIGRSVEGRELWVVKISDNVEVDEVEPEFKYISSMHGNEITGRELTQFWIKELLEGYGKDSRITEMVDNTELYVMPSMNPDGSDRRMRGNANWTDLNRNFPDWTKSEANSSADRQPETVAVMRFQDQRQFSLSANFHGGAVVVNYPWDSTYERHPFDELVKEFSLEYAGLNPEMRSSRQFKDGVTNGADWYRVVGGMQDWSYVWHNDLQVTIELSNRKWPNYSQIPSFYEDNKESMYAYARLIHQGAGFKLQDSNSEGKVRIVQTTGGANKDLGSYGFRGGEFYKVLMPGQYRFLVEAEGKKHEFDATVEKDKTAENGNYTYL